MAIRDWTPGRIRRMWAFGLIAELLVIYGMFVYPRHQQEYPAFAHPDSAFALVGSPADPRRQEWREMLRDSLGITVTMAGDTLTTFSRDSFAVAVLTRGDTVRALRLSPAAERPVAAVAAPIGRALAGALAGMWMFILLALGVTLLPIPLALAVVTLLWWRGRRRRPSTVQ